MKSLKCRAPFRVPAKGAVDYQYLILPTHFTADRWVQKVEVRPGNRATVHHAVVYIREPGSKWLEGEPLEKTFSVPIAKGFTTSDLLMVYTPGNSYDQWPPGIAKRIKAGSDLVLQMHYTASGKGYRRPHAHRHGVRQGTTQASRAFAADE